MGTSGCATQPARPGQDLTATSRSLSAGEHRVASPSPYFLERNSPRLRLFPLANRLPDRGLFRQTAPRHACGGAILDREPAPSVRTPSASTRSPTSTAIVGVHPGGDGDRSTSLFGQTFTYEPRGRALPAFGRYTSFDMTGRPRGDTVLPTRVSCRLYLRSCPRWVKSAAARLHLLLPGRGCRPLQPLSSRQATCAASVFGVGPLDRKTDDNKLGGNLLRRHVSRAALPWACPMSCASSPWLRRRGPLLRIDVIGPEPRETVLSRGRRVGLSGCRPCARSRSLRPGGLQGRRRTSTRASACRWHQVLMRARGPRLWGGVRMYASPRCGRGGAGGGRTASGKPLRPRPRRDRLQRVFKDARAARAIGYHVRCPASSTRMRSRAGAAAHEAKRSWCSSAAASPRRNRRRARVRAAVAEVHRLVQGRPPRAGPGQVGRAREVARHDRTRLALRRARLQPRLPNQRTCSCSRRRSTCRTR